MEVGNRIREERERAGLSQDDLAQEIFVSRQTVSNWETGKTYPDVQSLLLLSNLFGASVDSLVRGDMEAMDKKLENYELERFKVKASVGVSWALIVLGAVILMISVAQGNELTSPLSIVALVVLVAAVVVSFVAERIEKRYDIETIAEVKAFMEGVEPDKIERSRKLPKAGRVALQLACGAVAGVLFCIVLSGVMALTMFH